ncbi:N-acetylglucosamine-6-phosphate deacetylase [Ignatzschineria larvae DSM 13226]|uniref:N-acetylglucosamine-6-phosphate deacetylase n=1 Tax=Ignatzschineria larvae DSM 13226 TaxID=1111732 RepID=A0ABZ3C237_9GAMM|nr:N-acetylglucosamine-6-phosphate deacetylase [Ignatzschineria larvae]
MNPIISSFSAIDTQSSCALLAPQIYDGSTLYQDHALLIEKGVIIEIVPQTTIPATYEQYDCGDLLMPGFIDLQVNGGGGVLFNDEPNLKGIKTILQAHQARGTAALLPTLISADDNTIEQGIKAVSQGMKASLPGLLGIHIEGPMINLKRKGIHAAANLRILSDHLIDTICGHHEMVRLVTLAPEIVPLKLIEKLTKAGVIVFAGHTEASPERLKEAIAAGLQGFTHLYNAMPAMESRKPGTTGFAIQAEKSYASIIHDGLHVDPLMVQLAYRSKPKGKLFLVSDAMSSIGAIQNQFQLDDQMIYLRDGRLVNADGTLAGAHLDMAQALLNTLHSIDIPLIDALAMATSIPAQIIQSIQYGYLKKGNKAMINVLKDDKISPVFFK